MVRERITGMALGELEAGEPFAMIEVVSGAGAAVDGGFAARENVEKA